MTLQFVKFKSFNGGGDDLISNIRLLATFAAKAVDFSTSNYIHSLHLLQIKLQINEEDERFLIKHFKTELDTFKFHISIERDTKENALQLDVMLKRTHCN